MKTSLLTKDLSAILLTCLCITISSLNLNAQVTEVWETDTLLMAPESLVFDPLRNSLYISNYNDQGGFIKKADTLRNESISKLDLQGNVEELRWIDGLKNPTGTFIFNDKLYIVEREGLTIANIEDQKIEQKILIEGAKFLNDVVVDKEGIAYVSGSSESCIYRIKNGKSEVWFTDSLINSPNGLFLNGKKLLVGNKGEGNLLSVSLKDKTTKILASGISSKIDGIKKYKGGYLLSWHDKLHFVKKGEKRLIYNAPNPKDFLADFELIEDQDLIIIPKLVSGAVVALKLDL